MAELRTGPDPDRELHQPGGGGSRRASIDRRQDNTVYIQMSGGCQVRAADVTLKAGIERMIGEEIPR
jgi:Fe-S cluster biogenesis protein NfuA